MKTDSLRRNEPQKSGQRPGSVQKCPEYDRNSLTNAHSDDKVAKVKAKPKTAGAARRKEFLPAEDVEQRRDTDDVSVRISILIPVFAKTGFFFVSAPKSIRR